MMMLLIVLVCATIVIVAVFAKDISMAPYWNRSCTGQLWKRAFPSASAPEIREFLQSFIDGFAFSDRRRLCFEPNDCVMDIYRRVKGLISDNMELEFFAMEIEARYGFRLGECWRDDITLGAIFEAARRFQSRF